MESYHDTKIPKLNQCFQIGETYSGTVYSVKEDRVSFYIKSNGDKIQATYHIKGGSFNPFLCYAKGQEVSIVVEGIYKENRNNGKRRRELCVRPELDPIVSFISEHPLGSLIQGTIDRIKETRRGKILRIQVEGRIFIYASVFSQVRTNQPVICKIDKVRNENIFARILETNAG